MQTTKESRCKYVPISLSEDVSHLLDVLKSEMEVKTITGVFLDHDHGKFWRDISIMDEKGLLTDGTLIMADNALRHKNLMRPFIDEMKRRTTNFRLVDVRDPYPDQLLITEWKPITHHSDEL
jgi:predicted O-methyltransferase YrrM